MDVLQQLMLLEEKIEEYYIMLARLEVERMKESLEYQEYFKLIIESFSDEKELLNSLTIKDVIAIRKYIKPMCDVKESPMMLGHHVNAYYTRIYHKMNSKLGDNSYNYASVLRYDLNQIIGAFLEVLIDNPYYEDIRKDLIFYKYNFIFMNQQSEKAFLLDNSSELSLFAKSYRTDDFPAYEFVDKTVLVLEATDYITDIVSLGDDFRCDECQYTKGIVALLEVIARSLLCEKNMLPLIYDDLMGLLKDEAMSLEVKNLIQEMFDILEQLKDGFKWAR